MAPHRAYARWLHDERDDLIVAEGRETLVVLRISPRSRPSPNEWSHVHTKALASPVPRGPRRPANPQDEQENYWGNKQVRKPQDSGEWLEGVHEGRNDDGCGDGDDPGDRRTGR